MNQSETYAKARDLYDGNNFDESKNIINHILLENKDHDSSLFLLALITLDEGYPDIAVGLFNKSIRLNKQNAECFHFAGISNAMIGNYETAINLFDSAISLNQNEPLNYYNRGYTYQFLEQWDKSISDLNQALILDTNLTTAYYQRGVAYLNMDDTRFCPDFIKARELGDARITDDLLLNCK